MTVGFYSASQGLFRMQEGLDITSNNVANVNTYGYKPVRPAFADLIYTIRKGMDEDTEIGHGVRLDSTDLLFDEGMVQNTERALDFAVLGEGLFALQQADGTIVYTKDGSFDVQNDGEGNWYLVDERGANVLDREGNPIVVPYAVDEEGAPSENLNTEGLGDVVGVYVFPNPYGLYQEGDNYYTATASSGEAAVDPEAKLMQYWLERSSVSLADEMVRVIQFQRSFSANAKMVQSADEIQQIVNNLR